MILLLFLYDPLYASSHDLESDYPWSGLKYENYPIPHISHGMFSYIVLIPFQLTRRH